MADELAIFFPLPAGKAQYEGLKSAFVDFPRLLRTLRTDGHTGYVRLSNDDFSGVLLFHEGQLLHAVTTDGNGKMDDAAFGIFRRKMDAGEGNLDVIDLSSEIVVALGQLFTAQLMYTGLLGKFVNFAALLELLSEERTSGAVIAVGAGDIGIILLRDGQILGSYSQHDSRLVSDPAEVSTIASEKTARIEVKSGSGATGGLDIEAALSRAY